MNGNGKFEVDTFFGSRKVVDLVARTCSCRLWDLTGVPCAHAISAIYAQRELPEDYVSDYYKKETFLASYGATINPIASYEEWPQCDYEPILPPLARVQVGRPKKARKRAADEKKSANKVSKSGNKQRCGNCNQWGHNSRRCSEPENPNKRIYKRKNKSVGCVDPNENATGIDFLSFSILAKHCRSYLSLQFYVGSFVGSSTGDGTGPTKTTGSRRKTVRISKKH